MGMVRKRPHGALEAEVLAVLRTLADPVGAREIQASLNPPQPAPNTVLTVLDRLHKKGVVTRIEDSPRRVRFALARVGDESASSSMLDALGEADDREAALLRFAGNLAPSDLDVLRRALGQA